VSVAEIEKQLTSLCEASKEIKSSMVVSSDGLVIAHYGDAKDPNLFGALFLELKVVCEKIITQLDYEGVEEVYIRSKSGGVTVFPIFDKGYLACLSSVNLNAGTVQILSWKYVRKIYELL